MLEITWEDLEAIAKKRGVDVYVVLDEIVLNATIGLN